MTERDPRIDPKPGDLLESARGQARQVVYVTMCDQVVYDPPRGPQRLCDLKTWRRWAKGATVQVRAPKPISAEIVYAHPTPPRAIEQVRLIANRVMSSSPPGTFTTTPDEEVATALLELAIGMALADPRIVRRVAKRIGGEA